MDHNELMEDLRKLMEAASEGRLEIDDATAKTPRLGAGKRTFIFLLTLVAMGIYPTPQQAGRDATFSS